MTAGSSLPAVVPTMVIYTYSSKDANQPLPRYRFDCSNFRDPIGNQALTKTYTDGRAGEVRDWISIDPKVRNALATIDLITSIHFCGAQKEQNLSVGFYDFRGRWIAPAVAEMACELVKKRGFNANVIHLAINATKGPVVVGR